MQVARDQMSREKGTKMSEQRGTSIDNLNINILSHNDATKSEPETLCSTLQSYILMNLAHESGDLSQQVVIRCILSQTRNVCRDDVKV
uniref:AlNc14C40G3468 protein n=1 Tax=Albugo laibachii Nc14 TaxID=890382 RepID=F0W9L3_9STRA|nr:AlNc14C40G3468 [Albugo laibachii Nc14]|eukprot:CCA17831.1 AlNc14C40G3468 [Albugo laibachii Nc14]